MPDPDHADQPEVLRADRHRRQAAFALPDRLQHRDRPPERIIGGNERVVRPRLSDAKFFFEQDKKKTLAERVPQLANVVYHNKLGNQLQRTERVQALAGNRRAAGRRWPWPNAAPCWPRPTC
jgi:hypothetical protein